MGTQDARSFADKNRDSEKRERNFFHVRNIFSSLNFK